MAIFNYSSVIDAPVEVVFGFHERVNALELLTPPFLPVRVVRRSGNIREGAEVELRVGPLRWLARHTVYAKNKLFVDEQREGPFARWTHNHRFEDLGGKTRLTDSVEYELPGGRGANMAGAPFVRLGLLQIFRYRHRATKAYCERR
jgi:ligand-binding SRPBCC domain-containing protein